MGDDNKVSANKVFAEKKQSKISRNNAHTEYNLNDIQKKITYITVVKIVFFLLVILVSIKLLYRYRQTKKMDIPRISILVVLIIGAIIVPNVFKILHI